jgi:CcmD family protein
MNFEGNLWVAAANLIIWSGIFLYLLALERKIARREDDDRGRPPAQGA